MLPDFVYQWAESSIFLFVLFVTGTIALAAHLLFRCQWITARAVWFDTMSPVLQSLCGTMFALAVSFLASSVWQTEDTAKQLVDEEARGIRLIRTYLDSAFGPGADNVQNLLPGYVDAVIAEWPRMESQDVALIGEQRLTSIYRATISQLADGELNRSLQQRILGALDGLSRARQGRLTIANEHVSDGQWSTVFSLAFLLILVIAICHAKSVRARVIALTIITTAITVSLSVILAHDRPFVGRLAITPQPILDAMGPAK